MDYARLGDTGLEVSRICLGCMSYGDPGRGAHPWTLGEQESRPVVTQALDLGITFFDTANVYSAGSSEEILGRAIRDLAVRDEVILATKVHGRMRPGPNGGGLSRKAIMSEIDASLRRLGTDYVDLYQIHRSDRRGDQAAPPHGRGGCALPLADRSGGGGAGGAVHAARGLRIFLTP